MHPNDPATAGLPSADDRRDEAAAPLRIAANAVLRDHQPGNAAWALDGFDGGPGQTRIDGTEDGPVVRVGIGDAPDIGDLRSSGAALGRRIATGRRGGRPVHAVVGLSTFFGHAPVSDDGVAALAEGILTGAYRFRMTGAEEFASGSSWLHAVPDDEDHREAWDHGIAAGKARSLARDLVNLPPSALTPEGFAARARALLEPLGVDVRIRRAGELREAGFGGVVGIGQGSANPPALLELRYGGGRPDIAFVGKGVTFDSGGLSLKPAEGMITMKLDMAGAAAIVAAFSLVPRTAAGRSIAAVIPLVENMPDAASVRPGDVVRLYSGRTLEILNSDFEGRVILADALSRAAELEPRAIVDLATLTYAAEHALGRMYAALVSTDEALGALVRAAGEASGDRVWPMPLMPELDPLIRSDIADYRNFPFEPTARVSSAASLLAEFVPAGTPWAHIDMSGPAWRPAGDIWGASGGTGFGVGLIGGVLDALPAR